MIQAIADYQKRHPLATAATLGVLSGVIIAGSIRASSPSAYAQDSPKAFKKDAGSTANLTIKAYTSDDSSAVLNYLTNLRSSGQIIKTLSPPPGSNAVIFLNLTTPVEKIINETPTGYELMQNYPNPFKSSTMVRFAVPKSGLVLIKAYNEEGKEVGTLVDQVLSAGIHQVSWSPNMASGVYFIRMGADNYQKAIKALDLGGGNGSSRVSAPALVGSVQQPQASFNDVTGYHVSLGKTVSLNKILQQYGIEVLGSNASPAVKDTAFNIDLKNDTTIVLYLSRQMRNVSGTLTDYEGIPREGYLLAISSKGDSAVAKAGIDGKFSMLTRPSAGDTLKAQILNKNHPDGFIRTIYMPGKTDLNNVVVDAIPLLADSVFIGADTLASFAWEANFQPLLFGYEGLKKAKLDSLFEVISSTSWKAGKLTPDEQSYIKQVLEQKLDSHFKKLSKKYLVKEDSLMNSIYNNAINWFKDTNDPDGSISTLDADANGILETAAIDLSYVMVISGTNTFYNDRAILQEGLSGRVAPFEVGITSKIKSSQTVLHKNTSKKELQPSDDWLIKIAERFDPKTSFYNLLNIDNLGKFITGKTK